ncbi:uncharacterized protein JCM6883_000588 [Sporobolomyces salmoneus]|uniref:uncharacterized protein n=1 Tax=Sporobolomyces salmoneus TaxID=183962 RepID=UPI003178D950
MVPPTETNSASSRSILSSTSHNSSSSRSTRPQDTENKTGGSSSKDGPPAAVRSFPIGRTSSMNSTSTSPSPRPRPSRPSATTRPSYIALPPPSTHASNGFPTSMNVPPDVVSPLGERSVSSADSTSSRVAPDLGGSSARYFPMRNVMYPSASQDKDKVTSPSATSSRRSQGSGSVKSTSRSAAAGSRSGGGGGGYIGRVSENGAEEENGSVTSSTRPPLERRNSSGRTQTNNVEGQNHEEADSPPSSSVSKPRSLDPYLSEPTTHAKIGDPDTDEEGSQEGSKNLEDLSQVQERDFGDEETKGEPQPIEEPHNHAELESLETKSRSTSAASSRPLILTSRFEHQVTEDGEILILTGREGQLMRCEDEPIHAPGAIQAFGVLIAFEEAEDDRLVVRQVSENSGFILGLPPKALFQVDCLTHLLPEEEVDALFDALDAVDERDNDPSNEETGPYTFTLSGFGLPGTGTRDAQSPERLEWTCHAAVHRPARQTRPKLVVLELELVDDQLNPLNTVPDEPMTADERVGFAEPEMYGEKGLINPSEADLLESTVSLAKPLRVLARAKASQARRRNRHASRAMGEMDVLGLLGQINEQLGKAEDLASFLKIVAGVFRELTEFDRVMVYQFDEQWNGRVVAEQVDWSRTKDLFRGLNFPASDIPAQARELYRINKVRVLYDRDQPTARLCCRDVSEVETPLDMTHCHLRAMSPIHIKYLGNMGVRSSMSVSITAFGDLWGLLALHTYGRYGHRVSFPVRQLCKLLGESISRNIERISYARRLQARKLINTEASDANPSGYIVAKAEDLLDLFHADFGILSIGDEAKILGPVKNSQELLAVLEYLRVKCYTTLQYSTDIKQDFPDIEYPPGFDLISGMLTVPLSSEGKDFIVFFRRGVVSEVQWAGNPYANKTEGEDFRPLEPRRSFKLWTEQVTGKSRAWTDEEKETAGVLCLVYGKFIAVWREKENALARSQLTNLLLANASHEVRTPLNAIINYLELALDGPIQGEVRDNLVRSHAASKSLIHVINDLLDLTRTEKGNELFLTDPFDLNKTITEAVAVHRDECERLGITLDVVENPSGTPTTVLGDRAKVRQIVTNVVGNALKHTKEGGILVEWGELVDDDVEDALNEKKDSIRIGISITDTGSGIPERKLEAIFRQFEQVSTVGDQERENESQTSVGLGLAVVARIVRNLEGQLQVESKVGEGSKFTFVLPFRLAQLDNSPKGTPPTGDALVEGDNSSQRVVVPGAERDPLIRRKSKTSNGSRTSADSSNHSEIDSLINAMSTSHMDQNRSAQSAPSTSSRSSRSAMSYRTAQSGQSGAHSSAASGTHHLEPLRRVLNDRRGEIPVKDNRTPLRASRLGQDNSAEASSSTPSTRNSPRKGSLELPATPLSPGTPDETSPSKYPLPTSSPTKPESVVEPVSPRTERLPSLPRSLTEDRTPRPSTPESIEQKNKGFSSSESNVSSSAGGPTSSAGSNTSFRHVSEYRKGAMPKANPVGIPKMRVLVVEDELVNRMIIQQRLKKDGHDVVVTEHGGAAVRKFEEDRNFDIILMDLQMPIMGGLEATRNIRRVEAESPVSQTDRRRSDLLNSRVPIFAVTASLPERERGTIVSAGLDGWALKPLAFDRLRELMLGATDGEKRNENVYRPGSWERGGWLSKSPSPQSSRKSSEMRTTRSHSLSAASDTSPYDSSRVF